MELQLLKSQITLDTLIKKYEEHLSKVKDEKTINNLTFIISDLRKVQSTLFFYKNGCEEEYKQNTVLRLKILELENEILSLKEKEVEV